MFSEPPGKSRICPAIFRLCTYNSRTVCLLFALGAINLKMILCPKRQTFRTSSACLPPNCGLLVMMYSLSLRRELSQARLVTANAVNANGLGELTTRAIRKLIEYVASLYLRKYMYLLIQRRFTFVFCSSSSQNNILNDIFAALTWSQTYAVCYCSMRKCGPMFAGSLQRRIVAIDHYQHLLQTHRSESNGEGTRYQCSQ